MTTENKISFDDSRFKIRSRALIGVPEVPTVIRFLVGKKIVKTEKQAILIVLVFFLLCLVLSGFLIRNSVRVNTAIISPSLNSENK